MVLRLFIFMEIRLLHYIPTGFGTKLSYFFQDYAISRVSRIENATTFFMRELGTCYKRAPVGFRYFVRSIARVFVGRGERNEI